MNIKKRNKNRLVFSSYYKTINLQKYIGNLHEFSLRLTHTTLYFLKVT